MKPRLVYKRHMWRCMCEWYSEYAYHCDVPGWGRNPKAAYAAWVDRNRRW